MTIIGDQSAVLPGNSNPCK